MKESMVPRWDIAIIWRGTGARDLIRWRIFRVVWFREGVGWRWRVSARSVLSMAKNWKVGKVFLEF